MRWLLALSFSRADETVALQVARSVRASGIATYCYLNELAREAGSLLYLKHHKIFSGSRHVGLFLRPDYRERQYTELEYRIVTSRPDFPCCATFFVMEPAAEFLVPSASRQAGRSHSLTNGDLEAVSNILLSRVRGSRPA